jgi:hypothetical protein
VRLRRQNFRATVHTTTEQRAPITIALAGLIFDVTVDEAKRLALALADAVESTTINERKAP